MADRPDIDALAAVVYQAFSLIARRGKQMQATGDLTLPERVALARLDRGGPATAADLARVEQITPQAMRVTLASLETRLLVQRRTDPADGRRQVLSLTPAGVGAVRDDRDTRAQRFAQVLSEEFSPAELVRLANVAPLIERLGARF
jgi:DNA-binding MarR family transcriptional regulator